MRFNNNDFNGELLIYSEMLGINYSFGNRNNQNTINYPSSVSVDREGRIVVVDSGNNRVLRYTEGDSNFEVIIKNRIKKKYQISIK
mmetsp:Transcript_9638/g.8470  ORF Transcript_9638/g.8470 Transcript_9638/m.8470 type:complete len:86 (+) Transcript_9638:359-616(+)